MILIGIGLILFALAVSFIGFCMYKGITIRVGSININVAGIPSVHVPSVFGVGDTPANKPFSTINNNEEPVVVPNMNFDDSGVETNMNVSDKKVKGTGINNVATALKKTQKDKETK